MAKITEAVATFLQNLVKQGRHNNPALINWWSPELETQIFVSPEGGYPVEEKRNAWTNGRGDTWNHIRWPHNANAEPYWRDRELSFLLEDHCTFIGTTGWCWTKKETWLVAFDFDDVSSHAPGVGIDDHQLEEVRKKAIALPYVDTLKSTGGKGLHLYIRFDRNDAPKTQNHNEHAAIARALLGKMSTDIGFDFGSHLDVCGQIIWIWGKKSTQCAHCGGEKGTCNDHGTHTYENNNGHLLIKEAEHLLTAEDLPPNWRDHLEVLTKGGKIRVTGYDEDGKKVDEQDALTELSSGRIKYPLNEVHKTILNDLEQTGASVVWVPDHHLVQTHTQALKIVFDKWTEAGHPMKGFFETLTKGEKLDQPNCLGGDTKVITREGVKPIRALAGKTATIITSRGKWVDAPFKSYGEQDVFAVTLKNRTQTKVIKATADHRWFVCRYSSKQIKEKVNFGCKKEVYTRNLKSEQILIQLKPRLYAQPSIVGIQHGLVWGDGTNSGTRQTSALSLFGDKDKDLLKFFAAHPRWKIKRSVGGHEVFNLPYHFKSLVPLHYDKPYLYGWLAGYFAADGCVSTTGSCILRSVNRDSIEHVREVCHILGIGTTKITEQYRTNGYKPCTIYTTILKAADLMAEFFLITKHRSRFNDASYRCYSCWRVVSVEPAGKEEVFCCTVPETGCFCLEDFILSGNCFAIPGPKGSWMVYRFGKGTPEHKLWSQDDVGWSWCRYNWQPNLRQAALALGGIEDEKGNYIFTSTKDAQKTVETIGSNLLLPGDNKYEGRKTILRRHKDGRLVVELDKYDGDEGFTEDWLDKKNRWVRIYDINTNATEEERDYSEFDSLTRSIRTPSNADAGWMIRTSGAWVRSPAANVVRVLKAVAPSYDDAVIMGTAILNQWTLVNMPFHEEHPGGRQWNYGAAQFKYQPAGTEEPVHPHWDRILSHIGTDLDQTVQETEWCKKWNIHSGKDYLTAWIACMFREPFEPLPYLFIYGEQGCGKSIFHEVISLLVTGGIVKADTALTNQSDFNGELANGVLAVIDEKNISRAGPSVYNKIKEWVTSLTINIHRKGMEPYPQRNSLHFVQLANERDACPVIPGDTRIVPISMSPLIEEIPKPLLLERCTEEATHFMTTLMSLSLPKSMTRLRLPVLETNTKQSLMDMNRDPLESFVIEHCHTKAGCYISLKEFYERFQATLSTYDRVIWTKSKIKQNLTDCFPIGNYTGNKVCVGNVSFEDVEVLDDGPKFVLQSGKLLLRKNNG
jgi:Family of unknown function (DUF5906)/LAGLIDADG-like domain